MERSQRQARRAYCALLLVPAAFVLACGYGFGNQAFGHQRATAVAFAQALQHGDTARMRALSAPEAGKKVATLGREIPAAYLDFARPIPNVVTQEGGGIYGGTFNAVFLVTSKRLSSCTGGVRLDVATLTDHPQVIAVRPVPSANSVTDAACRRALLGPSGHS